MEMDTIDRKLLDIIQTDFPLTPRPYAELGRRLDITEAEALARVNALRQRHIIRRLGANFQSTRLPFHPLCRQSPSGKNGAVHGGDKQSYRRDAQLRPQPCLQCLVLLHRPILGAIMCGSGRDKPKNGNSHPEFAREKNV